MNKRQKARKRAWMKRVHIEWAILVYFDFSLVPIGVASLKYFPELKGFY